MSNDFEKILIKDPRMCCSDKISYGVHKSGQNVTTQVDFFQPMCSCK